MGRAGTATNENKQPSQSKATSAAKADQHSADGLPTWKSTLSWGALSIGLMWLAFPPLDLWPLAWVAAYGWIRIIRNPCLPSHRPLVCLYLIGWVHWLSMTYWVTLPHPAAAVGWLFLAAYLAFYFVGFLLLSRWLVHRNHVPMLFAVPFAWVAMEILRTYVLSGFGLVALSHSQVDFLPIIQIAKVTGAYGVSFLVMMVAAAFEHVVTGVRTSARWDWRVPATAAVAVAAVLGYGFVCLQEKPEPDGTATIAIIQGSLDTVFGDNDDQRNRSFANYSRMTGDVTSKRDIDLVLWPESMFYGNDGLLAITKYDPDMATALLWQDMTLERWSNISEVSATQLISSYGANCLVGTGTTHFHRNSADRYNTAAYYDDVGNLVDVYHKTHPVMFGEYLPLGDLIPWIYRLTPISDGLTPGEQPKAFAAGSLHVAPTICFENTVPHLVRRQVLQLELQESPVQALVTLTNDGWFWGSSLLDLHLACGIYRAVENRRPTLIAANTGISAQIDDCGRVLQAAGKRVSRVIVAEVEGRNETTIYTQVGDWFGFGCVLLSAIGIVAGYLTK